MPNVSIIIPAYNQDQFLEQTLLSVLSQSYKDFECIIVDDGSTDETRDITNKYTDGARIKYIYQDNRGLAGARNTGIKHTNGRFIHFLDSDDLIHKEFLKLMIEKLDSDTGIDILSCAWDLIDEEGRMISAKIGPARSPDYLKDLILSNLFPVHSAVLRREALDRTGIFNERLSAMEDWDLWLRAAISNLQFDTLDIVGVSYRRHKAAMTLDIKRMKNSLNLLLDNFFGANPAYQQYRPYTQLLQVLNIYLYSEESGDIESQKDLLDEADRLLRKTTYTHYYMIKIYETIRQIRDKKVKLRLVRDIYGMAPTEKKKFWKEKILKLRLRNILGP